MINYWWVTRPKRKLNAVPNVLAALAQGALDKVWAGQRDSHLSFEAALEANGIKRTGDRRDQTGGGARTYGAWLISLGLIFNQQGTNQLRLTLAGEAIMNGASPVKILTNQVLKYQFPSAFSLRQSVSVNRRFRIHPFWFLLKLLLDNRLCYLTQEEIAKIVICEAENESDKCYEHIVKRVLEFREVGDACLAPDFFQLYKPSKGDVNPNHPYSHLEDTANTLKCWLDYTQLTIYEEQKIRILNERREDVKELVSHTLPLIPRPDEHEYFQRRYGLDPWHNKDTRNLTGTQTVTTAMIAELLVKKAFVECSLKEPIGGIDTNLIERISESTGVAVAQVEEILRKNYPYGSIGAFMADYFELAFKGTEKCRQFEEATAAIFRNVFGFDSRWLGSAWSGKEVPDVLLVSGTGGYQAIIDTKAYSCYDLPSTQRDRMIHHYLPNIAAYSDSNLPVAFFSYIAGGFSNSIANPLAKVTEETGIPGSAMTVGTFIKLCEQHAHAPYSHADIKAIFSVGRKVELSDLDMADNLMAAERPQD